MEEGDDERRELGGKRKEGEGDIMGAMGGEGGVK